MKPRQFANAEEVERVICVLEKPMTINTISKLTGIEAHYIKSALRSLRFQGLVISKRVKNRVLWFRRGYHA